MNNEDQACFVSNEFRRQCKNKPTHKTPPTEPVTLTQPVFPLANIAKVAPNSL